MQYMDVFSSDGSPAAAVHELLVPPHAAEMLRGCDWAGDTVYFVFHRWFAKQQDDLTARVPAASELPSDPPEDARPSSRSPELSSPETSSPEPSRPSLGLLPSKPKDDEPETSDSDESPSSSVLPTTRPRDDGNTAVDVHAESSSEAEFGKQPLPVGEPSAVTSVEPSEELSSLSGARDIHVADHGLSSPGSSLGDETGKSATDAHA